MVGEIALVKIAAIGQIQLSHLAVGHVHAARHDRYHSGADLESKISVDLAAHRAHDGNFVANRFHVLEFVSDFLARPLAARLRAGLSRPEHDDVVAHVQEGMQHAAAQSLPVGQQQDHRRQAPHDAQHGECRALQDELFQKHKCSDQWSVTSGQ